MSELGKLIDELNECLREGLTTAAQLRAAARRLGVLAQMARAVANSAATAAAGAPKGGSQAAEAAAASALITSATRVAALMEQAARQCVLAAPRLEQAHRVGTGWAARAGASQLQENLLAPDPVGEAAARARDARRPG